MVSNWNKKEGDSLEPSFMIFLARTRFLGKIANQLKKVNQRKEPEVPSDRRACVKAFGCHRYPLETRVIDGCQ